ncbi:MAG: metallophosphoesterase family protein, partial [Bacteroidales bacterium]
YGPLNPQETYKMIKSYNIRSISGNEDRLIAQNIGKDHQTGTLEFVKKALKDNAIDWLISLPKTTILDCRVFMCHGTPHSDTTYLAEKIQEDSVSLNESDTMDEILRGVKQYIVFCGHSHVHRMVQTPKHTIINPGSVGCPAYEVNFPVHHKIENFNNHAQYCFAELSDYDITVEQVSVPYDVNKAVNCAIRNSRPDWANWLKTGRVK